MKTTYTFRFWIAIAAILIASCQQKTEIDTRIKRMDSLRVAKIAVAVESLVKPELAEGLSLRLWGVDSLVTSPIGINIDDNGILYYTTTNRQKNSEFDIRAHPDWEIASIALQTVEDRRAFLRKELSPENSKRNEWLADLNHDGSHDWKDMTVEKDKVFSLADTDDDGLADQSQLVVDDFNDEVADVAGSVLKDGDDLYVAIAPDLWKMKDKNGDGIADEKTSLSHGYGIHIGFSGHGMSGIQMGPDGRIYWQIGDIGFNGKDADGQEWAYPNSGVIARANPDGSDFEIFAAGLRNTHEFAFDEYGNLISEDNDGDHPGEKERLVYITNGSDAGWRSNWQYGKYRDPKNNSYKVWMAEKMYLPRFEGQAAYITPCISNFVSGPAGFAYNPGTALGDNYKNTFFVAEFVGNPAASGIHSFKLKPKGAGFELGENKKVLSGVLATGLDFGPDGALYVADWIEGWGTHSYGRIWKLDDKNATQQVERLETKKLLAASFLKKSENELGELLKHPDMRVRQKAQFELVKRGGKGLAVFQKMVTQTNYQLARVQSIWGISQLARKDKNNASILLPLLRDKDAEIRAQSAKWLGDIRYKEAGPLVLPLLSDESSRVRFFAAEAVGRMKYEPAIEPLIQLLQDNNDEDAYLRHAGCLALARIGKAAPVVALSSSPSRAVRIAAVVTLRRMRDPGITQFLTDKDEFVVTEAARAINDDLSIATGLPALGDLLNTTGFKNEALLRRVINANLRVGTDASMQNLIDYASKKDAPGSMKAEAIDALSGWAKPSVLDRVDGRYRGIVERDGKQLKEKFTEPLLNLLSNTDISVRVSAAKAIALLDIKQAMPTLQAMVKKDAAPEARIQAISSLVTMGDPKLDDAVSHALSDREKKVRVAGLNLLQKMAISKELMVKLLSDVIATRTTEEKQAALLTLGKLPPGYSMKPLSAIMDKMAAGKLSPDLYFELGEAVDSTKSAALIARFTSINEKLSPDALTAAYAGSLLGGDPENGRDIFIYSETAQCMKCHAYDDRGGNAGPRLNGIANRITRPQILEALISPGARLSPGYGMVSIVLKDGKKLFGILEKEDKESLTLKAGDQPIQVIQKIDIDKRTDAPSSMPDMKMILSKREIRDVVSFLSGLNENN